MSTVSKARLTDLKLAAKRLQRENRSYRTRTPSTSWLEGSSSPAGRCCANQ